MLSVVYKLSCLCALPILRDAQSLPKQLCKQHCKAICIDQYSRVQPVPCQIAYRYKEPANTIVLSKEPSMHPSKGLVKQTQSIWLSASLYTVQRVGTLYKPKTDTQHYSQYLFIMHIVIRHTTVTQSLRHNIKSQYSLDSFSKPIIRNLNISCKKQGI